MPETMVQGIVCPENKMKFCVHLKQQTMNRFFLFLFSVLVFNQSVSAQCWSKIASSEGHTLAIKTDGSLWAWGSNFYGQLGTGDLTDRHFPVRIGTATNWTDISAGFTVSMARRSDGSLWTWGTNFFGQLGNGTNTASSVPQALPGTDWAAISAGYEHCLAVKTDGTLWAWGVNNFYQLGVGSIVDYNIPVQVGTANDWLKPHAGSENQAALKTDGTLWVWGTNLSGQLGLGHANLVTTPVQMGTDNNWAQMSNGSTFMVALKTDGTIWAWGNNTEGQLGTGNTISHNTPQPSGSDNDWTMVATGGSGGVIAKKNNGTIWFWGNNGVGQAGNNTLINYSSPVQTGELSLDWLQVYSNGASMFGIKNDNSMKAWGDNYFYTLGDGTNTRRFSPVPISCNSLLPVTGLRMKLSRINHQALISWSTETETNNRFFDIEHSTDGIRFTRIGRVDARGGTRLTNYAFIHPNPVSGKNSYRIRQVDQDGQFTYSPVQVLEFAAATGSLIYPNPVSDQATVQFNQPAVAHVLQLFNAAGTVLINRTTAAGTGKIQLDLGPLPAGIYYLRVQEGTDTHTHKISKQ